MFPAQRPVTRYWEQNSARFLDSPGDTYEHLNLRSFGKGFPYLTTALISQQLASWLTTCSVALERQNVMFSFHKPPFEIGVALVEIDASTLRSVVGARVLTQVGEPGDPTHSIPQSNWHWLTLDDITNLLDKITASKVPSTHPRRTAY